MNARFILLTVVALAPLAALAAVPPVLETADDVTCERPCVEHAAELPVTSGKAPDANQADRVLGAAVDAVPRLVAVHLPTLLAPNQGLLVTDVEADSPIAAAGIVADDILHSCNAVPLLDSRQLLEARGDMDGTEPLVLGVIRKGVLYVTKLARRTPADERPARPSTVESPEQRPVATARSVVIRCDDGQIAIASTHDDTFDVRVTTPAGGERHFTGSREAIIGQIGTLPERLQTYIARGLRDQDPRAVEESEWPSRRGVRSRGNHLP